MASIKCAVCGQSYEISGIHVLGHEEDLWFLEVNCSSCQAQSLVAAVVRQGKASDAITDSTKAELDEFGHMDVVTADDVLDVHIFLKDYHGDFTQLFGQS